MDRLDFLGYPVDIITTDEAVRWVFQNQNRQAPKVIVVINAHKLWLAEGAPWLKQYIRQADLVLPEYAVVWGTRQLGLPEAHAVYGISFTQSFLSYAEEEGLRPFFLGSKQAVIQSLEKRLEEKHPRLKVAGFHHGYLAEKELETGVIHQIRESQPDILFVGMGSPRQEQWITENKVRLAVPVMIGVGGTFDVLSGLKKDTPPRLRGSGFEWLYRLAIHPRRYWKRYLITNPWFVWQVLSDRLRSKRGSRG